MSGEDTLDINPAQVQLSFVYNSDIRNNGTPTLCFNSVKNQLGWGGSVDRWRPDGKLPERELYIYCDDGRDDIDWECPHPNAYYAVDTHLGYDFRLNKAKGFDKVYCAQKEGVVKMKKDGIKNVHWLPLACNPMAHPNLTEMMNHPQKDQHAKGESLSKQYDLSFVGFINQGDGTPESNNRFNISIRNDLNMRFFEIMSSGSCLLTNTTVEGIEDLGFEDGKHFLGFDSKESLVEQALWGIENPASRERIAREGHNMVRKFHTYDLRMQRILDDFGVKLAA